MQHCIKYVGLTLIFMNAMLYLPEIELADALATIFAVVFTLVALLFTLPTTSHFTTAEAVLLANACYTVILMFIVGSAKTADGEENYKVTREDIVIGNLIMTAVTL
jgi:hypothetical protein